MVYKKICNIAIALYHNKKPNYFLSIFFFIFLFSCFEFASAEANENVLNLATGSKAGVYYPLGLGIAEAAKEGNIKIEVLMSDGSLENLKWLSQGKAQLCLAQSDTVYYAFNGIGEFADEKSNIKAIASFYTETVHILIRNPLNIKKIQDFREKRISVGPKGGGSESNALAVLEASGITTNEVQLLNLNFDDTLKSLNKKDVDIVFITSGIPSEVVKVNTQNNVAYLFELQPDILQRLVEVDPFFIITNIPSGTYTHQDEDITAIGVSALLVARNDLPEDSVYRLTKSIFSNQQIISKYHKNADDLSLKTVLKGITTPVSDGAVRFYEEKGVYRNEIYRKIFNYFLGILLIFTLIIAIKNIKKINYFFKKNETLRVFAVLLLIWFTGSFILYFAEHKINENYSNLILAFWATLINWISFGSKEPFTVIGRTTSVIMTILGVGGIAWFTGEVASVFVHKRLMGGRKKMEQIKNHYVLANWNEKAYGIIDELHSVDLGEKKPIIVISENTADISFSEKDEYDNVFLVKGNPSSEAILRRANIDKAYSIIVLANNPHPQIADAQSVLTILAIRKICVEKKVAQIPIIAEILDPQKVHLAIYAGIEGNGNIEIVSSMNLEKNLLAHAAVNPGLTKVFDKLLTFHVGGSEVYSCKIPPQFIGKSFEEFLRVILNLRQKNCSIIPIAINRNGVMYVNPSNNKINMLEEDDCLFVICDKKEDLKQIENL